MIVKTTTGYIHYADKGVYSGELFEANENAPVEVKRGRGRPSKNKTVTGAPKFDFSAFLTPINLKDKFYKGPSRVYKAKA